MLRRRRDNGEGRRPEEQPAGNLADGGRLAEAGKQAADAVRGNKQDCQRDQQASKINISKRHAPQPPSRLPAKTACLFGYQSDMRCQCYSGRIRRQAPFELRRRRLYRTAATLPVPDRDLPLSDHLGRVDAGALRRPAL